MNRKNLKVAALFLLMMLLSITTTGATQSSQTLKVEMELGEQYVDIPIAQIRTMNYALEFSQGFFMVNHIEDPEVKEQFIEEEEAYELGFIPDVTKNIPEDVEPGLEVLPNDKPVIVLGDNGYGHKYKQVISEEEVQEVETIIEEMEKKKEKSENKPPEIGAEEGKENAGRTETVKRKPVTKQVAKKASEQAFEQTQEVNVEGLRTPNTATNIFNYLILGVAMFVGGILFYLFGRKKKTLENN